MPKQNGKLYLKNCFSLLKTTGFCRLMVLKTLLHRLKKKELYELSWHAALGFFIKCLSISFSLFFPSSFLIHKIVVGFGFA